MKRHTSFTLSALILPLVLALVTGCASLGAGGRISPDSAQSAVDAVASLKSDLRMPENFRNANAEKKGGEFDVNRYFSVLTHLSMSPGHVLDYVYRYSYSGGDPVLYARKSFEAPYLNYSGYLDATGAVVTSWPPSDEQMKRLKESRYGYLDHVRTDGTEAGFFELAVLRVMGAQFYLWWHANYNDARIICNKAGLDALLSKKPFGRDLRAQLGEKAASLDLAPSVEFRDNHAIVKVVVFTKWGGFQRRTFTFNRKFPHRILDETRETLLRYDVGVMF